MGVLIGSCCGHRANSSAFAKRFGGRYGTAKIIRLRRTKGWTVRDDRADCGSRTGESLRGCDSSGFFGCCGVSLTFGENIWTGIVDDPRMG